MKISNKLKKTLRELKDINKAREAAGLRPKVLKVRTCNKCDGKFESLGERNCGCMRNEKIGQMAGRDIL